MCTAKGQSEEMCRNYIKVLVAKDDQVKMMMIVMILLFIMMMMTRCSPAAPTPLSLSALGETSGRSGR